MRISLITTCFNAEAHVADAIESAGAQVYPDLEHIVADAASTDGTVQLLRRYPHLIVDSRPDRGIYDGLNRGLAMASGDVIGFLNADDQLDVGVLATVAAAFADTPGLDMLTGAARVRDESGRPKTVHMPEGAPSFAGMLFGVPVLNARFFARGFVGRIGPFDLTLPAAADRAWLVRVVAARPKFATTGQVLYNYRAHAGSRTLAGSNVVGPRLWREHVSLADRLLGDPAMPAELHRLARQWRAVEATKLALRHDKSGASQVSRLSQLARGEPGFLRHLAAGLLNWRRLRGRHADRGA